MATTTVRRDLRVRATCMTAFVVALASCSGGDGESAATLQTAVPDAAPAASAPAPTTAATAPLATAPPAPPSTDPTSSLADEPAETAATAETSETAESVPDDTDASPPPSTDPDDDTAPPPDATQPATTAAPTATTDPAAAAVDWTGIATDLLDRHFQIAREPSLDLVAAVCLQPSGCYDDASRTVEVLLGDGVRLRGGAPFEVTSVEFQTTADGAPVDATLAVNLIVRFVATDQGTIQLVDDDGNVVSDVAPDERFPPGQATARAVIVGRDSVGAGWKLVALSDWM